MRDCKYCYSEGHKDEEEVKLGKFVMMAGHKKGFEFLLGLMLFLALTVEVN